MRNYLFNETITQTDIWRAKAEAVMNEPKEKKDIIIKRYGQSLLFI